MIPVIMGFDRAWPYLLAALLIGAALGALPMGLWVARAFGLGDPRRFGSGNVGATNMLRSGSKAAAALTLALDVAKAWAPAVLAYAYLGPPAAALAGLGAFLGHCFSPFLGFRGGKGVAAGFGALLAWRWEAAAIALLAWLVAALLSRRSSVGALAAMAAGLIALPLLEEWTFAVAFAPMVAVSVWAHRANIGRLLRGEEPKIRLGGGAKP